MRRAAARRSPQVEDVLTVKTVGCRSMERLPKVEAAHGMCVPRLNRDGGIAIVKNNQVWSLHG